MSLERELHELAGAVSWPPAPDVAAAIRDRIETAPVRRRPRLARRPALALALVLAVVAGALAVPQARTAILRAFGIGSVRVELVDDLPPAAPRSDLTLLGTRVTLAEARRRFPYPLVDPDELGAPTEIRLGEPLQVSFVWRGGGGVRLLVSQLPGRVDGGTFVKVAGPDVTIEQLTLDGHRAVWVAGKAHGFGLVSPDGGGTFEELRLSGNALLVADGQTTIRIEGDLRRARALELARTLLRAP